MSNNAFKVYNLEFNKSKIKSIISGKITKSKSKNIKPQVISNLKKEKNNNSYWYKCKDVLKVLGYSKNSNTLNSLVYKIDKKFKTKLGDLIKEDQCYKGLNKREIFINHEGLNHVVVNCRIPKDDIREKMIKEFGLNINVLKTSYEQDSITPIYKVLSKHWKCYFQYKVLNYRIDLYVPKIKLAIECDENGHSGYNKKFDAIREQKITQKLNCKFFRFNPNKSNFDIFNTIGDIISLYLK